MVLFGSLAREGGFGPWSDVDIAVWGLPGTTFFRAVADTFEMDPEIPVNLVEGDDCSPSLLGSIERDGIEL